MGWWEVERNGKELEIGDDVLDVMYTALKKIAKAYKRDLERKPTPEEMSEILESSIRVFEEDIFDDMEERELDSVVVKLKSRPKRPKPKAGDYFALPLPSGGYGYGRIMKVSLRVFVWVRMLDVRSEKLLSADDLKDAKVIFEGNTRTSSMINLDWPMVGNMPLTDEEREVLKSDREWKSSRTTRKMERITEWKLDRKRGMPPGIWYSPDDEVDKYL